jgi:hypothetical protein
MTTTRRYRDLPDDAPCTAFAPAPIGAYRRGWEDRHYDRCWFCPYAAGTVEAGEYAAGQRAAGELERKEK